MLSMRFAAAVVMIAAGFCPGFAQGAPMPADVLQVDLEPGIRQSAQRPERFAVDVPHEASPATHGSWSREKGVSTWRYSARIPTAVSMSFHAGVFQLPAGATLKASGGGTVASYGPRDTGATGLWSRVFRGDRVDLELSVPQSQEAQVQLEISSLQAGYRSLGKGVDDHPAYKKLRAISATTSGCIENFSCHENAGNFGPRNATGAITVGGVALCTATLVNNVRGDLKHYLLTARHCQDPNSGASSVVLYFDATVPCDAALASVYDTLSDGRFGGGTRTVVEQQDVWLIEFGPDLVAQHVYFAGWDATGGTFVGGYSPHHAQGRSRQYASWFGQALLHDINNSALGSGYRATFWGVVNQVGSVGSGASGGGLFDSGNHLVGTLSLAQVPAGGGDGLCPVASPTAPNSSNTVAEYNALAAVWDSTADTTSRTNPTTLKSVLDPDNTGTKVLDGFELMTGPYVHSESVNAFSGGDLKLTWEAPGATSCVADGGRPGDGWGGPVPLSGTTRVTEDFDGDVFYILRCTDGTRKSYYAARVSWAQSPPNARFEASPNYDIYVLQTKRFTWNSNVQPCVASGGVAGDGWAGDKTKSGTQDVVMRKIGPVSYTLTCGTGSRVSVQTHTTNTQPPAAYLISAGLVDNLRIGQPLKLAVSGTGNCTRTGGSAGDNWGSSSGDPTEVTATVAGTYTYTLTCTGDGQTATASVTATFNDSAPFVTLDSSAYTTEVGNTGYIYDSSRGTPINLTWNSNLPTCELRYAGPGTIAGKIWYEPLINTGNKIDLQYVAGTYTYTATCTGAGGATATATRTVEYTADHPYIYFYVPSTLVANQPFPFSWQSNLYPCVGDGGVAGDGWAGPKADAKGSSPVVEVQPGNYNYGVTCGAAGGPQQRQVGTTVVPAPSVTVTPNHSNLQVLFFNNMDWSATTAPCVLSSDTQNRDWTGSHYASGRIAVNEQTPGPHTYTATCGPPGATVSGSATVVWEPSPFPAVTFTASKAQAALNEPVTLTWNATNTNYCSASSTQPIDGWNGGVGVSGQMQVRSAFSGKVTFTLSCVNGSPVQVVVEFSSPTGVQIPFVPPTVTLAADKTQLVVGQSLTLSWNATHASECTSAGGAGDDGWTGTLPFSSSKTITTQVPGRYYYFVLCTGAPPSAQAQVEVNFLAPAGTSSSSSGGGTGGSSSSSSSSSGGGKGGGGGRIDWVLLLLLSGVGFSRQFLQRFPAR